MSTITSGNAKLFGLFNREYTPEQAQYICDMLHEDLSKADKNMWLAFNGAMIAATIAAYVIFMFIKL